MDRHWPADMFHIGAYERNGWMIWDLWVHDHPSYDLTMGLLSTAHAHNGEYESYGIVHGDLEECGVPVWGF
jgi:hypothetical protein